MGSGIVFLGLSLLVIGESWQVGLGTLKEPGSGFIPFCAGIILTFLSLLLIYQDWQIPKTTSKISPRIALALGFLFF